MKATNPTTRAMRRYLREFWIAIAAYVAILSASIYGLDHGVSGFARYVVAVVPVLPVIGVFVAVVRWLRATDEYQRQTTITAMAIAGGATALINVTYGFLETAGLPSVSVWTTYALFMIIWLVATLTLQRTSR
jgi:hypothetical protein